MTERVGRSLDGWLHACTLPLMPERCSGVSPTSLLKARKPRVESPNQAYLRRGRKVEGEGERRDLWLGLAPCASNFSTLSAAPYLFWEGRINPGRQACTGGREGAYAQASMSMVFTSSCFLAFFASTDASSRTIAADKSHDNRHDNRMFSTRNDTAVESPIYSRCRGMNRTT